MAETTESEAARPRAPRNRGPRRSGGGRGRIVEQTKSTDEEPKEPREIILSPPVPASMIGMTVTGKICDIVKRGRGQFGFIFIGEGTRSETPRIYFSFKDYNEENLPPRRGYLVEFECAEDEAKRAYASNVRLTERGLEEASERNLKYPSIAEREKEPGDERERRGRRPRKDYGEGRSVVLKVTCEGKSETKQVTADVTQSLGKLKHAATVEFDAPIEYNVFCRVTGDNPEGVLLTKAIFTEMSDNDMIHIRSVPDAPRKI